MGIRYRLLVIGYWLLECGWGSGHAKLLIIICLCPKNRCFEGLYRSFRTPKAPYKGQLLVTSYELGVIREGLKVRSEEDSLNLIFGIIWIRIKANWKLPAGVL